MPRGCCRVFNCRCRIKIEPEPELRADVLEQANADICVHGRTLNGCEHTKFAKAEPCARGCGALLFPFTWASHRCEASPSQKFSVGQWVRLKAGGVLCFVRSTNFQIGVEPIVTVDCDRCQGLMYYESDLEPAVPRAGEWWVWNECLTHKQMCRWSSDFGPHRWRDDQGDVTKFVGCCLVPVNYGRGE
jgi:hypothetical protein